MNKDIIIPFIQNALNEDVGDGDHTSLATIPAGTIGKAQLLVKDNGVIAGVELANTIFNYIDDSLLLNTQIADGAQVQPGQTVFTVEGSVHSILKAERLLLNSMQRMSGIATTTRRISDLIQHTGTQVLDTRKTTPGMRYLEKWAVRIGGGVNHRFGLYDMILIKDNHVDYAGGIQAAIQAAKVYLEKNNKALPIEIEVRNMDELAEVLQEGGIDRILLDNFAIPDLLKAIKLIDRRFITEASGGITESNVLEYAQTGVNFVSMGMLTHSVKSLDLSLKAIV